MECAHSEPRQTRDTAKITTLAYQRTETRMGKGPGGGKEEPHRVYTTAPPTFGGEVSVVSRYESLGKRQVLRVEVFDATQQPLMLLSGYETTGAALRGVGFTVER